MVATGVEQGTKEVIVRVDLTVPTDWTVVVSTLVVPVGCGEVVALGMLVLEDVGPGGDVDIEVGCDSGEGLQPPTQLSMTALSLSWFAGKAATKPTRAAARILHEARMVNSVELGLGQDG